MGSRGGEGQWRFSFEDLCTRKKLGRRSQHEKVNLRQKGEKWPRGERGSRVTVVLELQTPERGGQKNKHQIQWIKYEATRDFFFLLPPCSLRGYSEEDAMNKKSQCGSPVGGNTTSRDRKAEHQCAEGHLTDRQQLLKALWVQHQRRISTENLHGEFIDLSSIELTQLLNMYS